MGIRSSALESRLRKLTATYARELPEKVVRIDALASTLTSQGLSDEDHEEFVRSVHKLAGSGATFGFAELGAAASELESILHADHTAHHPPAPATARSIAALVERMAKASNVGDVETPTIDREFPAPDEQLVWIVSDDRSRRRELGAALQVGRYVVKTFAAPYDVPAPAGGNPVCVVFDLRSPSGPRAGIEAVRRIREDATSQGAKIVFITGDDDVETGLRALRASADRIVPANRPLSDIVNVVRAELMEPPRYRILLLDDDSTRTSLLTTILDRAGFEIVSTRTPTEYFAQLDTFRPDLVLVDVFLPGCTGNEIVQLTRSHPKWTVLPVVVLGSEQETDALFDSLNVGADATIVWPAQQTTMARQLRLRAQTHRLRQQRMGADPITGLLCAGATQKSLSKLARTSERDGVASGIIGVRVTMHDATPPPVSVQRALGLLVSGTAGNNGIAGSLNDGTCIVALRGVGRGGALQAANTMQAIFEHRVAALAPDAPGCSLICHAEPLSGEINATLATLQRRLNEQTPV